MLTVTSAQLNAWFTLLLLPLTRILGLIAIAPLFGESAIPARIKLGLGLMLALIIAPTITALPNFEPVSLSGLMLLSQQFVIGLAMGFAMRIVFIAVELAAELTSMTMGLGFATFFNPQSQGQTSVISQFMTLLMTLIFLAVNGHLLLIGALGESFKSLPLTTAPIDTHLSKQLIEWAGIIFTSGVQLALPMVAALLICNVALGVLTRAAPQLNLYGIGFPLLLSIGFIAIGLTLPYLTMPIENLLQQGLEMVQRLTLRPAMPG